MRKLHTEIEPNTPEWLALRATKFNASEAPAMMGESPYMTRTELMALKKAGVSAPVTKQMQYRFDQGHAAEAAARPVVSAMVGEELKSAVMTAGNLLASLDGRSESGELIWEHKLWNASLAAAVQDGELTPAYYWQLEQQLLVSGADEVLFVVSDGTKDNLVSMFYTAVPGRAEQLTAGWAQFEEDLKAYVHVEAAPQVVADPVESLPAVSVQMGGQLVVASNLPEFGAALRAFIERIPEKPNTDQEFANCESACKALKKAEDALEHAETHALAQITDVESMRRMFADLRALARTTRLAREKDVVARKEAVRLEVKQDAERAFAEHIATINKRLGRVELPTITQDFAGVMKGKRSLDSMRDAVDTELARVKIKANAVAEGIEANLKTLRELAPDHVFLFRDAQQIITKAADDFTLLVKSRLDEHDLSVKAAARKVEDDRIEADRVEALRVAEVARIAAIPVAVQAPVEDAAPVVETKTPAFELVKERTVEQEVLPLNAAPAHRVTVVIEGPAEAISIGMAMLGGRVTAFYDFDCSGVIRNSVA